MNKVAPAPTSNENITSQSTHVSWAPKLSQSSRRFSTLSITKIFKKEDIYDLKSVADELAKVRSSERTDHSLADQNNRYHNIKPWYYRIFQFPKVRRYSPMKFYRYAQHGDLLLLRVSSPVTMIPLSNTLHHHILSTLSGKYIPKNYVTGYWNEVSLVVVVPDESRMLVKYALSINAVGVTLTKLSTLITKAQREHEPLGLRAVHVVNDRVAQEYILCLRKLSQVARAGRLTWYNIGDIASYADAPIVGSILSRCLSRLQFIVYQHSHESIVEASRCYNLMNPARDDALPLPQLIHKMAQLITASVGGVAMLRHFEKMLERLQEQQAAAEEDILVSMADFISLFATVTCTEIPTECDIHAVASAEFTFSVLRSAGVFTEEAAAPDHYYLPQVFSSRGMEIREVTTKIKPWVGVQKFMVAHEVYMDDDVILKIT